MLKAYSIKETVIDQEISQPRAQNLDIIIKRVLGEDEQGKPGEVKLYRIDKNIENHRLRWFVKEVLNQLQDEQKMEEFCDQLAGDLLRAEFIEDETIRNKNILQGVLIIKITEQKIVLIKLEEIEAIDPITFAIRSNIGLDRAYLKAAVFTGDESSIRVIDRQRQVANFWSSKFLQLIPVRTDLDNTQIIANAINENKVLNNDAFTNDEAKNVNSMLAEYVTKESHFDLQEVKDILQVSFPDKPSTISSLFQADFLQSIDEQFEISGKTISAAFRKTIQVNELVTIVISNIHRAKNSQFIDGEKVRSTRVIEIVVEDAYLNDVMATFTEHRPDQL